MLVAVEARCREVRYCVPPAISLWLAVLDGWSSGTIVGKRALAVATTIVLLAGKPMPQSLRAFAVQCHSGAD
jgi:hypothetical protein